MTLDRWLRAAYLFMVELRRIRYFVVVAEELHFGRAAKRLHMAQPPLSQQIRQLERDFGVTLFERSTRRVNLTAAGRRLLPEARRLLATADVVERVMDEHRTGDGGTLRIGFVDSASYGVLPRFLQEYRLRWPSVSFEMRTMSSEDQLRSVASSEIDVAIGRTPADDQLIRSTKVVTERLFVAVGSSHRLASRKSIRLKSLVGETFIGFDRVAAATYHAELTALLRSQGVRYDPVIEAPEYTTILGLVAAGEGIALTPAGVRTFQPPGLSYLRVSDPGATVALSMLTRRDDPLDVVARAHTLVGDLFS